RSRWQEVRDRLHQDRLHRFFRPWRPGVALEEDPRAGWGPPALRPERRSPDAVRADQVGHALRDRENTRGGARRFLARDHAAAPAAPAAPPGSDRKSTRLNSSHQIISY